MDNYFYFAVETNLAYFTVIARSYSHVEEIINEASVGSIFTIELVSEQTVCMYHHGIVTTLAKED